MMDTDDLRPRETLVSRRLWFHGLLRNEHHHVLHRPEFVLPWRHVKRPPSPRQRRGRHPFETPLDQFPTILTLPRSSPRRADRQHLERHRPAQPPTAVATHRWHRLARRPPNTHRRQVLYHIDQTQRVLPHLTHPRAREDMLPRAEEGTHRAADEEDGASHPPDKDRASLSRLRLVDQQRYLLGLAAARGVRPTRQGLVKYVPLIHILVPLLTVVVGSVHPLLRASSQPCHRSCRAASWSRP